MAQAPSLHDFEVQLSHVDRGLDLKLSFRTARHPSETLERTWLRALAYCIWHEERLAFGPGLCDPDAPDLETHDNTGRLTRWLRVGKADPLKVQRACDQNADAAVAVLFESPGRMQSFIDEAREAQASRLARAELAAIDPELLRALASDESRRAKLTLTVVGDHLYVERNGKSFDGPLARASLV